MTQQTSFKRTVIYVFPLLLWMTFIFCLSTDNGSAAHTRPVVRSLLKRVWPQAEQYLTAEQIDRVDWNVRKAAHITEYGILGILAFRALSFGSSRFRSRQVIFTLLIGVFYAASDEYHQSFVPSRGAAAADVFFDTFGVLSGLALCLWNRCFKVQKDTT